MGKALIIKGADFSEVAVDNINIGGKVQISITMLGEVTISAAGASAIYYTTDGSTPTTSSSQYSQPFNLNHTTIGEKTVKAIATFASGDVVEATPKTYKLEANAFTWGKGGISVWGSSSGSNNTGMSMISPLPKAESDTVLVINSEVMSTNDTPYSINAYATNTANRDAGKTYVSSLELSNLQINAGLYYEICLATGVSGINADTTQAHDALLIASVY